MAITRNYSGPALAAAGVICILLSFIGKLSAFVGTVPVFVSGGLALYLFGAIGMQGIALIQEHEVNLFEPLDLAVGAVNRQGASRAPRGFEGGVIPPTRHSAPPNANLYSTLASAAPASAWIPASPGSGPGAKPSASQSRAN